MKYELNIIIDGVTERDYRRVKKVDMLMGKVGWDYRRMTASPQAQAVGLTLVTIPDEAPQEAAMDGIGAQLFDAVKAAMRAPEMAVMYILYRPILPRKRMYRYGSAPAAPTFPFPQPDAATDLASFTPTDQAIDA